MRGTHMARRDNRFCDVGLPEMDVSFGDSAIVLVICTRESASSSRCKFLAVRVALLLSRQALIDSGVECARRPGAGGNLGHRDGSYASVGVWK